MFEFLESKAMDLIDEITKTATEMDSDAEASLAQANQIEQEATQAEADATAEEGSCPHYKDVEHTETETDEDTGETHSVTVIERVADLAEDAASRARAASLRARAATLKATAAALRELARALGAQLDAMKAQRQKFADAVAEVNKKAEDTKQKLNEGTGFIVGAIRAFSVPIVSGAVNMVKNTTNSILGNVGIDLSDGFDKKDVYGLTGWIAQTTVDTEAFVVKTFVSTTVASMLGGGMMGTTGAFVVGKVVGPTIDEAFGEKAVEGVHTFLTSALEFLGIKAKPDEKETATAGTGEVETILAGDKANIGANEINNVENGNKQDTKLDVNQANGKKRQELENQLSQERANCAKLKGQAEQANKDYLAAVDKVAPYQTKLHTAETNYKNAEIDYNVWKTTANDDWNDYIAKRAKYGEKSYLTIEANKKYQASVDKAAPYQKKFHEAETKYKNAQTDYSVWKATADDKWKKSVEANKKVSSSEKNIKSLETQISNLNK